MRAMADQDSAVDVHSDGVVRGTVVKRDPDAIVAEIERTRADLARTIDSIAEWVSPANTVRRLRQRAMEQAAKPAVQLTAAAVGAAVVGLVVIRIWARRRH
jgi:anti-sigma factor RsiW